MLKKVNVIATDSFGNDATKEDGKKETENSGKNKDKTEKMEERE